MIPEASKFLEKARVLPIIWILLRYVVPTGVAAAAALALQRQGLRWDFCLTLGAIAGQVALGIAELFLFLRGRWLLPHRALSERDRAAMRDALSGYHFDGGV